MLKHTRHTDEQHEYFRFNVLITDLHIQTGYSDVILPVQPPPQQA